MPLLATAVVLAGSSAVATEPPPTNADCIASSESAQDLLHAGQLLNARAEFRICVAASCPGPIREDCALHLHEIAKAMVSVIFDVKDLTGHDVVGVTIVVDGRAFAGSSGSPIELEPGEHSFTFESQGRTKVERRLVLAEGVKRRHEPVVFPDGADNTGREAIDSGVTKTPETVPPTPAPSGDEVTAPPSGPPTLATAAFVVGGAGLLLGITAGLVAGGKHSRLSGECDNSADTCAPRYAGDLDAFHTWRTVSTVSYVVGALGVASGMTLWLTAPKPSSATAVGAWVGPAAVRITGKF